MKFIIGKKLDMTQVFGKDGVVVPVTRVQAGPCVITQVKTKEKDGVKSVQVGFGTQKLFRINKPTKGHLKDLKWDENTSVRFLKDFKVKDEDNFERGQVVNVNVFNLGEKVQVVGTSKGKGFQGVVKRHHFAGGPASHGHKDNLRMPGSIGSGGVQKVFKGLRMGGHMGCERVTVKNLEIIDIKPEENILFIKGAVPGARGGVLLVSTNESNFEIENLENMLAENTKTIYPDQTSGTKHPARSGSEVIEVNEEKEETVNEPQVEEVQVEETK